MKGGRPNIIFIMLDTARADYFKAYGGEQTLQNIDALCKRSAVYANAIAPGTYTVPSHVSLFLGKPVSQIKPLMEDKLQNHDKHTDPFLVKSRVIKPNEMTLSKKLSYIGYDTALFSNNPLVTAYTGIGEGFSYLSYTNNIVIASHKMGKASVRGPLSLVGNDIMRKRLVQLAHLVTMAMPKSSLDNVYLRLRNKLNRIYAEESKFYDIDQGSRDTNKIVKEYCRTARKDGNFMFINYMEAHEGYPTNLVSDDYVEQDKWLYMSGIADPAEGLPKIQKACEKRLEYLDMQVGRLMRQLKEDGMLDNTVLIFGGDHGQGFMEHGQMYHSMFPYNEIVHVPLICAKFENGRQVDTRERIEAPVSLTALHDSIMDIGYGKEEIIDGSLRRDNYVVSEHTGITEVWDAYLLKLIRNRSRHADAIYRTKLRQNTFATAIYHGDYKLLHYKGGKLPDELYNMAEDKNEAENLIGKERKIARSLLSSARNASS